MWHTTDLYDQRAVPLGEKFTSLSQAYVEMDLVVCGPGYPLVIQHPCERDKNIHFVEEGHLYTVVHDGIVIPCTSVTTVAHGFFPHFDSLEQATKKLDNVAGFSRYDYYVPVVDFIIAYLLRHVQGELPFSPELRQKTVAFNTELAKGGNPPIVWAAPAVLLERLHADAGIPVQPAAAYNPFNLRSLLDTWFKKRSKAYSLLVAFAISALRYLWFNNGRVASTLGTYMHENIEFYYNQEPYEVASREYELFARFDRYMRVHEGLEPYRTEWKVYDEDLRIVGTIDMLYWDGQDDTKLWIYDWKRSKKLVQEKDVYWAKRYGTTELTKGLVDCNFSHYSMQLNIYKTILERKYGRTVMGMFLVILHPNQKDPIREAVYTRPTLSDEIVAYQLDKLKQG